MELIEDRTFDEIKIGESASLTRAMLHRHRLGIGIGSRDKVWVRPRLRLGILWWLGIWIRRRRIGGLGNFVGG